MRLSEETFRADTEALSAFDLRIDTARVGTGTVTIAGAHLDANDDNNTATVTVHVLTDTGATSNTDPASSNPGLAVTGSPLTRIGLAAAALIAVGATMIVLASWRREQPGASIRDDTHRPRPRQ